MAVPSSLSVDGNSVTLNVDHANPDVAYPVVADPWVMVKRVVPVWRCCRPVYRYETRIDHYVNELRLVTWAPGSTIFRYPHTALGGNLYSVRMGGSIGTVLMINQPTSPVWWAVRVPVYKTVPVYDHSEPWIDLVEQQAAKWVDDPSPQAPSSHPIDDPSRYRRRSAYVAGSRPRSHRRLRAGLSAR